MSCRSWWLVGCVGMLVAGASGCRENGEPESVGTHIKVSRPSTTTAPRSAGADRTNCATRITGGTRGLTSEPR